MSWRTSMMSARRRKLTLSRLPITALKRNTTSRRCLLWRSTGTSSVPSTLVIWWRRTTSLHGCWTCTSLATMRLSLWTERRCRFWSMTWSIWPCSSVSLVAVLWPHVIIIIVINFCRWRQLRSLSWNFRGTGDHWRRHRRAWHPICQIEWREIGARDWNLLIPCSGVLRDWSPNYVWRWVGRNLVTKGYLKLTVSLSRR